MKTLKSFYRVLKAAAPQFRWYQTREGKIRAYLPNDPTPSRPKKPFCPITAVHYSRTKEYVNPNLIPYLPGIDDNVVTNVVEASDNTRTRDDEVLVTRAGLVRNIWGKTKG